MGYRIRHQVHQSQRVRERRKSRHCGQGLALRASKSHATHETPHVKGQDMQRRALSRVGRLTDVNIDVQVAPGFGHTFGGGPLRRAEQLKQKLQIHGAESQGHWRGRATTGGNRAGVNVMHGARSLYGGKQKHKDAPRCAGCGAAVPARTARSHIQAGMNRAPRRAVALDDKGTLRG